MKTWQRDDFFPISATRVKGSETPGGYQNIYLIVMIMGIGMQLRSHIKVALKDIVPLRFRK